MFKFVLLFVLLVSCKTVDSLCEVPPADQIPFCSSVFNVASPVYREDNQTWSQINTEMIFAHAAISTPGLYCTFNSSCDEQSRLFICTGFLKKCDPNTNRSMPVCQDTCKRMRKCFMGDIPESTPRSQLDQCQKRYCNVDGVAASYRPVCTDWSDDPILPLRNFSDNTEVSRGFKESGCPMVWISNKLKIEFRENSAAVRLSHIYAPDRYLTVGVSSVSEIIDNRDGDLVHFEQLETNRFNVSCRNVSTDDNFLQIIEMTRTLSNGAQWSGTWQINSNDTYVPTINNSKVLLTANSFKLTWGLTNWQFVKPTNRLSYAIRGQTQYNMSEIVINEDDPLKYFGYVSTNNVTFSYSFLRHINSDGQYYEQVGFYRASDLADGLVRGIVKDIGWNLRFPSFTNFSEYDPDFSVLFGGEPPKDPEETQDVDGDGVPDEVVDEPSEEKIGSMSMGAVAGITIAIIAVVAVAAGAAIYVVMRRKRRSWRKKVSKFTSEQNTSMEKSESHSSL